MFALKIAAQFAAALLAMFISGLAGLFGGFFLQDLFKFANGGFGPLVLKSSLKDVPAILILIVLPLVICAGCAWGASKLLFRHDTAWQCTALALLIAVPVVALGRDFLVVTRGDQALLFMPIQVYGTLAVGFCLMIWGVLTEIHRKSGVGI
jgi:hypothetical protein